MPGKKIHRTKSPQAIYHCQICGRKSPVLKYNRVTRHGYKVRILGDRSQAFLVDRLEDVCPGSYQLPYELDRSQIPLRISALQNEIEQIKKEPPPVEKFPRHQTEAFYQKQAEIKQRHAIKCLTEEIEWLWQRLGKTLVSSGTIS
jgi:uncharacterized small protein (DUF1192 family)